MRKLKHAEIPRHRPAKLAHIPRHPITVVLDHVRSLHNVGSIFRTSDAAYIEKVVLTGITGTPDQPALHKTALGAQDTVPWVYQEDALTVITNLKAAGYTIAALEITDSPTPVSAFTEQHFPLCLVVGNELRGVQETILEQADMALEIPQYGTKQSLNVSVAYGVAALGLVECYRTYAAQHQWPIPVQPVYSPQT